MTSQLLTRKEVAERLQVSERTLMRLERKGELPHIKLGKTVRYEPQAVWDLIERHTHR